MVCYFQIVYGIWCYELVRWLCLTQLAHLVMKTEYEGIRAELSDLEQTLQPSKQSHKGHHLEAGIISTGPTPEVWQHCVSLSLSELNRDSDVLTVHTDVSGDGMSIFAQHINTTANFSSSWNGLPENKTKILFTHNFFIIIIISIFDLMWSRQSDSKFLGQIRKVFQKVLSYY